MSYTRRSIGRKEPPSSSGISRPSHVACSTDATQFNNSSALLGRMDSPTLDELWGVEQRSAGATHEEVEGNADDSLLDEDDNLLDKVPRVGFAFEDELVPPTAQEFDARGRLTIHPTGDSFYEKREVLGFVKKTIHSYFDGPWPSFSKVPKDTKHFWWTEFENNFCWEDRYATRVKANWKTKCSSHIRNVFCDAHKTGRKPPFIKTDDWIEVKRLKDSPRSKLLSEANKSNRAFKGPDGTAIYTGGSRSVPQNIFKFEREKKRRMTQKELVKSMYYSEKSAQYTGERPSKCLDRFKQLCVKWQESHPCEIIPQKVVNDMWSQANGGAYKGRVCGQGTLLYGMCDNVNPPARYPSLPVHSPSPDNHSMLAPSSLSPVRALSSPSTEFRALSPPPLEYTARSLSQPPRDFPTHAPSTLTHGTQLQRQVDQPSQVMGTRTQEQEATIRMQEQEATIRELRYQLEQEKIQRMMGNNRSQDSHTMPSSGTSFKALLNSQTYPIHDLPTTNHDGGTSSTSGGMHGGGHLG